MQNKHAWVALALLGLGAACSGKSTENQQTASAGASTQPTAGASSSGGGSSSNGGRASASGGAASAGPNTPIDQFTTVYAAAACGLFERCWKSLTISVDEGCESYFNRLFDEQGFSNIEAAVQAGTVKYHPEALPACLAELEQTTCDSTVVPDCYKVFVGSQPAGGPCSIDAECGATSECISSGTCPGACAPLRGQNESCNTQSHCAHNLECVDLVGTGGTCLASVAEGALCDTSHPCGGLLDCEGMDDSIPDSAGICRNRDAAYSAGEGAACTLTGSRIMCKLGLSCVFTGATIGPGVCRGPLSADSPCSFASPDQCPRGQFCQLSSPVGAAPATGQCTNNPKQGEPCPPSGSSVPRCEPGQFCHPTTEVCTVRKHLGEACSINSECLSVHCSPDGPGGKCVFPLDCEVAVQ